MVFWRRGSLLIKLVVVVATAWFTIAVLVFRDSGTLDRRPITEPLHEERQPNIERLQHIDFPDEFGGDAVELGNPNKNMEQPDLEASPVMLYSNDKTSVAPAPPQQEDDNGPPVLAPPEDLPGEMGKAVFLPWNLSENMQKMVDDGWLNNGFNQYVSDIISVHRTLPDPRDEWCKKPNMYLEKLPSTSVIICFHNEAWSALLRTVHSVLDRSPPELIHEVILVDDYSNMDHLKSQLVEYWSKEPKVKIIRTPKRVGLINARLLGFEHATGEVLTYLDAHCECTVGWLEPLLDQIARNSTTVVCPNIDKIDGTTLAYIYLDSKDLLVGGFNWDLQFRWHSVPKHEKVKHENAAEPVWSPTMLGGLFSIDREFFKKLGTYDDGFDIWGGENLELSFKTWMCGGTLEIVPCSHVGHIFRTRSPYKWRDGVNVIKRNSVRLAEVWLDDYAKYYYQRIGNDKGDYGDISSRKALRKNLGCKSFQWYLDNIFPELFIPGDTVAQGENIRANQNGISKISVPDERLHESTKLKGNWNNPALALQAYHIRNLGYGGKTCLDSPARSIDYNKPVGLYPCHKQGGNQYWFFSEKGEIRRDDGCLDYAGREVTLYRCHGSRGNQYWDYSWGWKTIRHGIRDQCLSINAAKTKLLMLPCDPTSLHQRWIMENYNKSKVPE